MTAGISVNNTQLNLSQRLPVYEKFNPLSDQPKLFAQLDMPNPVGDAARDVVIGGIAAVVSAMIASGKHAFDQAWLTLKPLLVKAKIKGAEGFKTAGAFIKWLNNTGAKVASSGNSKLETAFNQLLKGAQQAGIIPVTLPINNSDAKDRLNRIYKEQQIAKDNTGLKDGIKCQTDVNIGRINGTATIVNAKTTATNSEGVIIPVNIEQYIYTYDTKGVLVNPRKSIGVGELHDKTATPGMPPNHVVLVKGFCQNAPSIVNTIDRPYAK